jgi:hypothetical protein
LKNSAQTDRNQECRKHGEEDGLKHLAEIHVRQRYSQHGEKRPRGVEVHERKKPAKDL